MKRLIYISACICILVGLTAYMKNNLSPTKPFNLENMQVEEKYYPKFVDVEEGQETLKALVFGSIGWSLNNKGNYLFAWSGAYILRYDITENKITQIIGLGESYNGWPLSITCSSNGRYCIVHNFDFYGADSRNYFLIDFERQSIGLICDEYSEAKAGEILKKIIPNEIKTEVTENLEFYLPNQPACCSIEWEPSPKEPYESTYIFEDKNGNSKELISLQNMSTCGGYTIIDENRVGAITEHHCEIGYYKFVIVDVKQDKIIQEYILNKK